MTLIHHIGEKYKYPEPHSKGIYTLKEVDGYIYRFECGHRVMDSVFGDLIRLKTGKQVYKIKQLEIF